MRSKLGCPVEGPANGSDNEQIFRERITDPTDEVMGSVVELEKSGKN